MAICASERTSSWCNRLAIASCCTNNARRATSIDRENSSAAPVRRRHLGRSHLGGFGVVGRIPARCHLALWP